MILSNLASPLALAMFFFQDDASAPSVPVGSPGSALLEMVRNSGPVAFAVLIILLIASIFSWSIMFSKWRRFASARKQSQGFLRAFRKSGRLSEIAVLVAANGVATLVRFLLLREAIGGNRSPSIDRAANARQSNSLQASAARPPHMPLPLAQPFATLSQSKRTRG